MTSKHSSSEIMVILVIIAAALSVTALFTGYVSVTGKATADAVPTAGNVMGMLSGASIVEGTGKTRCNIICANTGESCIIAYKGAQLTTCSDKIDGPYECVCGSPTRVISERPRVEMPRAPHPSEGETKLIDASGTQIEVTLVDVQQNRCIFLLNGFALAVNVGQESFFPQDNPLISMRVNQVFPSAGQCDYELDII